MTGAGSRALSPAALATVVRRAQEAAPEEACGSVRRSGPLRRARNVQDELHRSDPLRYPRTARTAFEMSADDLLEVDRSLAGDDPVEIVYHSHPGGAGAYFSAGDERRNVVDGTPLVPVDHLVVAVGTDGGPAGRVSMDGTGAAASSRSAFSRSERRPTWPMPTCLSRCPGVSAPTQTARASGR
ncbi:MAG: Mov34/MPN/PAD-1 family protein [Actinomycetota bacterium]